MAEKQVNEAAFLKNLQANRAAMKAAAKEKRPDGVMKDPAILQRFGLDTDGASITLTGNVSKITTGNAKQDVKRPYFRFAYSVTENSPVTKTGKGTIVSNYHELTEGVGKDGEVFRTIEESYAQLFYEFQGIGENTEGWTDPAKELLRAMKEHTSEKTPVMITLSAYAKKDKTLGLNVRVDPMPSDDDLDEAEVEEEEYEDDAETEEELAEEEDSEDEAPNADWVGFWVHWEDDSGPDNALDVKLTAYDEDADTFTGTDAEGDDYEDIPSGDIEYIDPQPEDEE